MRYLVTVALAAFAISFFLIQPSHAEALNSAQLKKLLTGNTLYLKDETRKGRPRERWEYFQSDGTWKRKMEFERRGRIIEPETESSWRLTNGGAYCLKNHYGNKACSANVRVVGDTVTIDRTLDGKKAGERKYKLLKGNPKGL